MLTEWKVFRYIVKGVETYGLIMMIHDEPGVSLIEARIEIRSYALCGYTLI